MSKEDVVKRLEAKKVQVLVYGFKKQPEIKEMTNKKLQIHIGVFTSNENVINAVMRELRGENEMVDSYDPGNEAAEEVYADMENDYYENLADAESDS